MIAERLRAFAEDNPGRLAIVDGQERITYGELLQRIDSSREWLHQRLHMAPGDVILGSLQNSWQFVACFFAIAESGGVFMPVHPGWRAPELQRFCERLKVHGVIAGRASRHEWDRVVSGARVLAIEDGFGEARRSPQAHAADGNATALYLATSGSTGIPRIVPRSHRNLLAGARNVARALTIVPGRRFLCVVPFYHSSGFHNSLILPLLNGARLILMRNFTPAACARLVAAEGADVLIGSPFIYRMLLGQVQDLRTLDLCISAGARMPQTLALAWQERFGTRVRQLYGSTETSVVSIDRSAEPPPSGTVGTPIDEVEIRILTGGEVAVRSPMVMSGYVADPECNLRVFEDGFFRTGDLGCLGSDGQLRLFGRTRRVINLAGVKVDPVEIEQAVESLEGVVACHVDSDNGDRESELIRARIELREGVEMTRADVIAHCRRRLAEYKLPRLIEFVEALPVTLAGKISSAWSAGGPRPLIAADRTTMPIQTQTPLPEAWLNLAALLPSPLPIARFGDGQTVSFDGLRKIYSEECARIELLDGPYGADACIPIPEEVAREYAKYRPTPVHRARGLEKVLGYAGAIYFKREDLSPTGSHKPNTAIPQAYYARKQDLAELITDTGAGQWGCALGWSCHNLGLRCTVFMTRNSYSAKPYRRYLMQLAGATVIASPSPFTERGRALFDRDSGHPGSLGIGMSEAMELVAARPDARLALGCMSYYAALHQTVIGVELAGQLQDNQVEPDLAIGCVGGGTNFTGFIGAFAAARFGKGPWRGKIPRMLAVESDRIPVLTQGEYRYEFADAFGLTPQVKMYTLGREFLPEKMHAGGLRYHGKSPLLSYLFHHGVVEASAVSSQEAFNAGRVFFESEGILAAPESCHAIAQVIREAGRFQEAGEAATIAFCLSGTGYLDLQGYADTFQLEGVGDAMPVQAGRG